MRIILSISLLLAAVFLSVACGGGKDNTTTASSGTPTEAYKRLYDAVKAKNTDEIKSLMSKRSQDLAQMSAQRQNVAIEKVFENGFTATTFSPSLPEMRDERIKGAYGALEVWNSRDSLWEDLPFVLEDGQWKMAFGDVFAGSYVSPGKGRDVKEKEAANAARGGLPPGVNVNTSMMANMNAAGTPDPRKNKAK